jgi:hypothetical protein
MKLFLSLTVMLLLTGCGKQLIDDQFRPYVDEWNNSYKNNIVDVPMSFANMLNHDGTGRVGYWDGTQVTIDPTFWSTANEGAKKQLVWHELGHAMFNYAHDFDCIDISTGEDVGHCWVSPSSEPASDFAVVPRSIMFPWTFGEDAFYSAEDRYYTEQLANCVTCTTAKDGGNDHNKFQTTTYRQID